MPCLYPTYSPTGYAIPCGKCKECRARLARHWSFRLQQEMRSSLFTFFCTYTYDDEHLPIRTALVSDKFETLEPLHWSKHYYPTPDGVIPLKERVHMPPMATGRQILDYYHNDHDCAVVNKKDVLHYIRSLRNELRSTGYKFKYWLAAEYGKQRQRPHYHALIFVNDGELRYWLDLLSRLWIYGMSDITLANDAAAVNYCNKYMRKKDPTPFGCVKPFRLMSKHLGIAWLKRNSDTLKSLGKDNLHVVFADGAKSSIPRYYRRLLYPNESGLYNDLKCKVMRKEKFEDDINKFLANGGTLDEYLSATSSYNVSRLLDASSKTPPAISENDDQ